jgi:hypothetical protein
VTGVVDVDVDVDVEVDVEEVPVSVRPVSALPVSPVTSVGALVSVGLVVVLGEPVPVVVSLQRQAPSSVRT